MFTGDGHPQTWALPTEGDEQVLVKLVLRFEVGCACKEELLGSQETGCWAGRGLVGAQALGQGQGTVHLFAAGEKAVLTAGWAPAPPGTGPCCWRSQGRRTQERAA